MNNKGQSLTGTIVGISITSIVGLLIAGMISNVQGLLGYTDQMLKVEELNSEIALLLSDRIQCRNTFYREFIPAVGGTVTFAAGRGIRRRDDTILYLTNSPVGARNINIASIVVRDFVSGNASGVTPPYTGRFTLEIRYSYRVPNSGAIRTLTRQMRVKSFPANWNTGTPMANSAEPAGCSTGLGATAGVDLGPFVTRNAGNDIKYNDLRVNGDVSVSGNITVQGAGQFSMPSDSRLKKNFELLRVGLDELNVVKGYEFKWKNNDKADYGFMADEVDAFAPSLVRKSSSGKSMLKYHSMIPFMQQSLNSGNDKSSDLENRIRKLKNK